MPEQRRRLLEAIPIWIGFYRILLNGEEREHIPDRGNIVRKCTEN